MKHLATQSVTNQQMKDGAINIEVMENIAFNIGLGLIEKDQHIQLLYQNQLMYKESTNPNNPNGHTHPANGKLANLGIGVAQIPTRIAILLGAITKERNKLQPNSEDPHVTQVNQNQKRADKAVLKYNNKSKPLQEIAEITPNENKISITFNKLNLELEAELAKEEFEKQLKLLGIKKGQYTLSQTNNIVALILPKREDYKKMVLTVYGLQDYNASTNSVFYDNVLEYIEKSIDSKNKGNSKAAEKYEQIAKALIAEHNKFVAAVHQNASAYTTEAEKDKKLKSNCAAFAGNCVSIIAKDSLVKSIKQRSEFERFATSTVETIKPQAKSEADAKAKALPGEIRSAEFGEFKKQQSSTLNNKLKNEYQLYASRSYENIKNNDIESLKKDTEKFLQRCNKLIAEHNKLAKSSDKVSNHPKQFIKVAKNIQTKIYLSLLKESCTVNEQRTTITFDFTDMPTLGAAIRGTLITKAKEAQSLDESATNKLVITFKNSDQADNYLTSLGLTSVRLGSNLQTSQNNPQPSVTPESNSAKRKSERFSFFHQPKQLSKSEIDDLLDEENTSSNTPT